MVVLAQRLSAPPKVLAACAALRPAYVGFRYPDIDDPVDVTEAAELVRFAEVVVAWAPQQIS